MNTTNDPKNAAENTARRILPISERKLEVHGVRTADLEYEDDFSDFPAPALDALTEFLDGSGCGDASGPFVATSARVVDFDGQQWLEVETVDNRD